MLTLPITKQAKQQEWKIILTTAQNIGFPKHIIHSLKKKLTSIKERQNTPTSTKQQIKKWVTFTHYSPLIRKITNLFKQTNKYSPTSNKYNTATNNRQTSQHKSQWNIPTEMLYTQQ
jgi:hypothetical protein